LSQGEYSLTGSSDLPPGEINIIDALTVAEHIEGIKLLDGIALLAADVDGDNAITWADYDYILTDHLVYGYPFPVGDWVFEKIEFTLDDASGSSLVYEVIGSSTAEVKDKDKINIDKMPFIDLVHKASTDCAIGQQILLEIKSSDTVELAGFLIGLTLQTNLLELVEVSCALPNFGYGLFDDRIIISAATKAKKPLLLLPGDALVQILASPKQQILNIEKDNIVLTGKTHFVNNDLKIFSPQIKLPIKVIDNKSARQDVLFEIWPNPVMSQLNIEYFLEEEAPVTLSLFSSDGRFYHTLVDQVQMAGFHSFLFNRNGLPQGLYILNLSIQGSTPSSAGRSLLFIPE